MANETQKTSDGFGISGLPRSWAVVVQLVGTFGLAVFLVLYYVVILQPKEAARYEELRESVESLVDIVANQQNLLTRDQSSRLEDLYALAMAHEVADLIEAEYTGIFDPQALERKIEDKLIENTRSLEGLQRKDGGVLSEMLIHKIRNSRVSQKIAEYASTEWKNAEHDTIVYSLTDILGSRIRRATMAK